MMQFVRLERVGLARCGHCGEKGQCTKAHAHVGDHTFALGMEEECDVCGKGMSRHAHEPHAFEWSGRLTTERCGCGPNQACSRCSTPGAVSPALEQMGPPPACTCGLLVKWQPHREGCRLLAWMRAADQGLKAAQRRVVVNCRCLRGFAMLRQGETAECTNCRRMLVHPADEATAEREASCAHQWLPHGRGAWCPNCDVVRAPPRDPR